MALERDPDFTLAYAEAAFSYTTRKENGWIINREQETAEAARLAKRAVELGRDDAVALCFGAITLAYMIGDVEDGAAFIDKALALDPNMAAAWFGSGFIKLCQGELDTAVSHTARAIRLSPFDPSIYIWQADIALAHFCAGKYSEAVSVAKDVLRDHPAYAFALRVMAASYAMAGDGEEARKAMVRLRNADPQLRMSNLGEVISPLRPEHLARYIEGLRLAGLPE
jgi:tetratricopeptide (TPR) repeat protein